MSPNLPGVVLVDLSPSLGQSQGEVVCVEPDVVDLVPEEVRLAAEPDRFERSNASAPAARLPFLEVDGLVHSVGQEGDDVGVVPIGGGREIRDPRPVEPYPIP